MEGSAAENKAQGGWRRWRTGAKRNRTRAQKKSSQRTRITGDAGRVGVPVAVAAASPPPSGRVSVVPVSPRLRRVIGGRCDGRRQGRASLLLPPLTLSSSL